MRAHTLNMHSYSSGACSAVRPGRGRLAPSTRPCARRCTCPPSQILVQKSTPKDWHLGGTRRLQGVRPIQGGGGLCDTGGGSSGIQGETHQQYRGIRDSSTIKGPQSINDEAPQQYRGCPQYRGASSIIQGVSCHKSRGRLLTNTGSVPNIVETPLDSTTPW